MTEKEWTASSELWDNTKSPNTHVIRILKKTGERQAQENMWSHE